MQDITIVARPINRKVSAQDFQPLSSVSDSLTSYRRAALYWCRFGFSVIPITPGTKKPVVTWDGWLNNLSTEKITSHWLQHPDHEVGFIVGDDLVVFDADSPESIAALAAIEKSFDITSNFVVKTKRGEHHYFKRAQGTFARSDSHSTENHPERLDVKTGRAVIILPPSTGKILLNTGQLPVARSASEITEISQDFIDAVFRHNGRTRERPPEPFTHSTTERPGHNIYLLGVILGHLDPDMGYDDWLHVGMALHRETGGSEEGFDLFDDWSSKGQKYHGERETEKKWRSFRLGLEKGFSIGTLFMLAAEEGVTREMICAEAEPFEKIGGQNDAA